MNFVIQWNIQNDFMWNTSKSEFSWTNIFNYKSCRNLVLLALWCFKLYTERCNNALRFSVSIELTQNYFYVVIYCIRNTIFLFLLPRNDKYLDIIKIVSYCSTTINCILLCYSSFCTKCIQTYHWRARFLDAFTQGRHLK